MVNQTFDEELFFSTNDNIYALEEIPVYERTSINFAFKPMEEKPEKLNIPDAKHPWRSVTFLKHVSYKIPTSEMIAEKYRQNTIIRIVRTSLQYLFAHLLIFAMPFS
ncbi:MAG: hypothetical protein RR413_09565 [Christensenellaceae bacterium]